MSAFDCVIGVERAPAEKLPVCVLFQLRPDRIDTTMDKWYVEVGDVVFLNDRCFNNSLGQTTERGVIFIPYGTEIDWIYKEQGVGVLKHIPFNRLYYL